MIFVRNALPRVPFHLRLRWAAQLESGEQWPEDVKNKPTVHVAGSFALLDSFLASRPSSSFGG